MSPSTGDQVESLRLRKLTFSIFFFGLIPISVLFQYPAITGIISDIISTIGMIIILITVAFAIYIHSLFPRKHERPEDFDHLMTDGPYKYVRHPLYSTFIVMGFGIALYFVSFPGILFNIFLIFMWEKLAETEEKELLEYWGDEYREFIKTRPRFFPRIIRKIQNQIISLGIIRRGRV